MIFNRAIVAFKKLSFCFQITATLSSFFTLLYNSKRYTWSKSNRVKDGAQENGTVCYPLNLQNTLRPVYLRTYAGDIQIFYDIFLRSVYQSPRPHFTKAKTIIDLGAHIGLATLFFKLQAPNAIVYAVEADEKNFQLLLRNLEPEITNKQVMPIHAAVTNGHGTVYLQRSPLGFNTSISATATTLVVRNISIEQILTDYRIGTVDFLKIDIEGAEGILFSGECGWLTKVNNILIEIHSDENLQHFTQAVSLHRFRVIKMPAEDEDIYWASRI